MQKVPERETAKAAGERFYFTGKPCKNGHIVRRYTSNGLCSACVAKNVRKWEAKRPHHPARIEARARGERHYSGHPCVHGHDLRFTANGVCVECAVIRQAKYHATRPGVAAKWARDRRKKNPQAHRDSATRWYRANRDRARAAFRRWRAANPERVRELARVAANRRRTRKAENGGTFTVDDIAKIFERQGGRCAVCPTTQDLEIDHIMPICLGGSSDPENLQLLCFPCNRAKGSKHPDEWRKSIR